MSHPSGHFSGDYISAIRGCRPLKFLYTLEIEQGYIAHTTTGTGVSPQKKYLQKKNIWPKIKRVRLYNFAAGGSSLMKLIQITCREGGVIMWVQFLEDPPLKFGRAKKRPNFDAISDNFRL